MHGIYCHLRDFDLVHGPAAAYVAHVAHVACVTCFTMEGHADVCSLAVTRGYVDVSSMLLLGCGRHVWVPVPAAARAELITFTTNSHVMSMFGDAT